jgi:hypothetical protein
MENFNLTNYAKQNSPDWAQKVGDISLACGAIGAAILALPMAAPVVLPVALVSVAGWLLGVGTIGKAGMKCVGIKEEE